MKAIRRMSRHLPYINQQGYFPGNTQVPFNSQFGNSSSLYPYLPNNPNFGSHPIQPAVQPSSINSYQGVWPNTNSYNPYLTYANPSYQQQLSPDQLLQNPLQPPQQNMNPLFQSQQVTTPFMNPYPKHQMFVKQKPGGSLLNSFKSQDGSIDLNKMINTAGQMMHAVQQVSSMVKGLGSMFKV
ncbi:MAG TPA: YppG family protein [Bacillus sp. (in: firmicutes)]|uniref:YppG family protein n=1 Tax=Bacillus litorisediminis TaxID=2922713 RepID=UPI001FAC25CE|nr:YppG family protein [Bacillus litorisediminis]HWO76354.1 YppG family protein [Bacillus sp. (in: firmicutes)]